MDQVEPWAVMHVLIRHHRIQMHPIYNGSTLIAEQQLPNRKEIGLNETSSK